MRGEEISAQGAVREWHTGWPVVLAAAFGLGVTSLYFYTLGLMIAPLKAAFGWSQAQITTGPLIISFFYLLLGARVGALVDRVGVRKVVLPGYAGFCIALAMLGLAGPHIWTWYALWILLALVFTTTAPSLWTLAVVSHFERSRALALSIALCSTGIMSALTPIIEAWAIETGGWRLAYFVLGGGMLVIGTPVLWFTLPRRAPSAKVETTVQAAPQAPVLPGLTFREALAAPRFWMIAAVSLLIGGVTGAMMVHLASIGLAKGLTIPQVAAAASLIGITAIGGRLVSGYILDRASVKLVGVVIFLLPVIAAFVLLSSVTTTSMAIAAVLLGICGGGDFNVLAMLTSRYLGMRSYAAIFGQIAAAFNIGVGLGPLVAGALHDRLQTYEPILIGLAGACVLTALFTLALGSEPRFAELREPSR